MQSAVRTGHDSNPRGSRGFRRFVLPLAIGVLVLACVILLKSGAPPSHTVSQVIRDVHAIALKSPDGGLIGSWWISAADIDPLTGELLLFHVECGPLQFGAKAARVVVNHEANTFQFDMRGVVVARADRPEDDRIGNDYMIQVDAYTLGPIPYQMDIVADDGLPVRPSSASLRSDATSDTD